VSPAAGAGATTRRLECWKFGLDSLASRIPNSPVQKRVRRILVRCRADRSNELFGTRHNRGIRAILPLIR
jgi:hypothetical protein